MSAFTTAMPLLCRNDDWEAAIEGPQVARGARSEEDFHQDDETQLRGEIEGKETTFVEVVGVATSL